MKLYVQFMIILIFSLIGEAISTLFHLPVPGSIIGLVLLFLALEFKIIRLRHIDTVGNFLLGNMTILFLPAAVGKIQRYQRLFASYYHHHFRGYFTKCGCHWSSRPVCQDTL